MELLAVVHDRLHLSRPEASEAEQQGWRGRSWHVQLSRASSA